MKNRISIGISSIVLIFLILCLSVFSLLSLSDAKTALTFSERHANAVRIYYETDAIGQTFLRDYRKAIADGTAPISAADSAAQILPIGYTLTILDNGAFRCDIPMANEQTLRVTFDENGMDIWEYYVYNDQEYTIDTRMPVFGADMRP